MTARQVSDPCRLQLALDPTDDYARRAAAVNYAMTRTFPPEPSYHLFYDLGASSLRATLVSLKSALLPDPYSLAAKPELKNVTSLNVHGVGFDVGVGGYQFDRIVRDMMIEEVERKGGAGTGVKDNKRAMVKLLKEAGRVKQVLSANTEAMARVSAVGVWRVLCEKLINGES